MAKALSFGHFFASNFSNKLVCSYKYVYGWVITRFTDRSAGIITIPSKPMTTGYKMWDLADRDYVYDFLSYVRGPKPSDGP